MATKAGTVDCTRVDLGANEVEAVVSADLHKGGVFSQKSIPGVEHGAVVGHCSRHNVGDVQVPGKYGKVQYGL